MRASYFSQAVSRIAGAPTLHVFLDLNVAGPRKASAPRPSACRQTLLPLLPAHMLPWRSNSKITRHCLRGNGERSHVAYDVAELPQKPLRISSPLDSCFTSPPSCSQTFCLSAAWLLPPAYYCTRARCFQAPFIPHSWGRLPQSPELPGLQDAWLGFQLRRFQW